jgi:hypothetical protein
MPDSTATSTGASRVRLVVGLLAAAVVGWITSVMWSDGPAENAAAGNAIPFIPDAWEEPIQNVRGGWGDADAHVVLWAIAAVVVAGALRRPRDRMVAFGALAAWSVVVEWLQPSFTELRERQLSDAIAGVVGVGLVALADVVIARRRTSVRAAPAV